MATTKREATRSIKVPIRLTKNQIDFYRRVAQSAGTDINTVLCVVLALAVAQPTPEQRAT